MKVVDFTGREYHMRDYSTDNCRECGELVYPEQSVIGPDGTYHEECWFDLGLDTDGIPEEVELPEYSGPCYGRDCRNQDVDEDKDAPDSWCASTDQGDR